MAELSFPLEFSNVPLYLLLTLAISSLLLLFTAYQCIFHHLAKIPGPFFASLSRAWMAYHSRRGTMHIVMRQLHGQYGRLVRTAPNEISVADISAIKEIYGPGSKFVKAPWYSVWKGTQKVDLFAEREIGVHATLRRNVSRMYAMSSVTSLEPWVDNAIGCFMDQMRSRVGQPIDFGVWLQLLAFDVIGEISFSRRFGFLEAGCDDGTLNRIERALRSLCWVGQVPWVYWLEHYLSPIFGHHLDVKLRHGRIRTTAAKEVSARKTRPTEHQDILGHLFQVQQAKPDQVDENTVTSIATANIFAGSDTTAISLRAVFYFLLRNPHCLHKLMDEIETGHADGRLSFPVRFSQASDMPYLQACINEALRLHPAVGMSLPRVVPPGGMKIGSNFIPEGTIVGANPWVIHRQPSVWGADVEAYRPERWLEGNRGEMERCFLAFGGGARSCIGKNISILEMSKLIPEVLHTYDIRLEEPNKPLSEKCYWFVKQEGFIVRMSLRKAE